MGGAAAVVIAVAPEDRGELGSAVAVWFVSRGTTANGDEACDCEGTLIS